MESDRKRWVVRGIGGKLQETVSYDGSCEDALEALGSDEEMRNNRELCAKGLLLWRVIGSVE